jgi:hypothetical protein
VPRAPKKCGVTECDERVVGRSYCRIHSRRPPSPSSIAARSRPEQKRRANVVREWVNQNGWWCPGWRREAHYSRDLTAAHSVAVAFGGTEIDGVLCRSCNSRQNSKPS